ncbi:hypothetical protein SNOG_06660 [Parastagonospora nodorum SN15]|uniref:Uncharacterized protein n=1 Tax=Phaeosphaeria nodorum (strain SN15 / ATCC MYA-4574 / FGSC 10173) TaxID=321614 RepID=Q0UNK4_PHANO|nr:hypothetical protein SNOG_06660 [Parastagonospora nodorum SN15]EAT86491.1 hypothetical protein SNOG_06660 [Parastagonospora nodorum SN15]
MPSWAACVVARCAPSFMLLRTAHAQRGRQAAGFAHHHSSDQGLFLCSLPLADFDESKTGSNAVWDIGCHVTSPQPPASSLQPPASSLQPPASSLQPPALSDAAGRTLAIYQPLCLTSCPQMQLLQTLLEH